MDDRKKKIIDLEKTVTDNQASFSLQLEGLGKALLSRSDIAGADKSVYSDPDIFHDIEEYRRLNREIDDSEASIKSIEAHIAHLHELEEDIKAGEQEENANDRELAGYYTDLGKLVMEDPALDDFSATYRTQTETLVPKIKSLEDRLGELTDQTGGGNVFTWIGKNAQGMVLRSFLTKATDNLERLYRNAGEQFYRQKNENSLLANPGSEIADLGKVIEKNKEISASLSNGLKKLKEERRVIDNEFSASGGPLRQIQGLRKNIGNLQEALGELYLHFGAGVYASTTTPSKPGKKRTESSSPLITGAEQKILDEINRLNKAIQEDNQTIEKLRASLAIDDEKDKIEKYYRSIAEKKNKITEAEQSIAEMEGRIRGCEKHIEELKQLL
ncbi:MAG: hypothetical protein FWF29_02015 [Treponema sp.]|nr:hypothetical protein [Treponema sp.]